MANHSQADYLLLSGFGELQGRGVLFFCVTLASYSLIMLLNVSMLALICARPSLHRPMYVFLANLLLNTMIGCATFYPKLLHDLLREVQLISRSGCLLQAFCVHSYVSVECNILTVMAYDRYAAVARPLAYHSLLSSSAVYKLLAVAWTLPLASCVCLVSLSARLPLCGSRLSRVFCDNRSITQLSCVDVSLVDALQLLFGAAVVFLPLVVIFCCYMKILSISLQLSKSKRGSKALSTCVPHLVTYVSLVTSIVFEVVQPALAAWRLPHAFRVVMSMEGFLVPPLLNPLIYGLKLPQIRASITGLFLTRRILPDTHLPPPARPPARPPASAPRM